MLAQVVLIVVYIYVKKREANIRTLIETEFVRIESYIKKKN